MAVAAWAKRLAEEYRAAAEQYALELGEWSIAMHEARQIVPSHDAFLKAMASLGAKVQNAHAKSVRLRDILVDAIMGATGVSGISTLPNRWRSPSATVPP
jgi:hypothetical protein